MQKFESVSIDERTLNRRGEWSEIACRKRREERRLERERGMTGQGETRQRKIDASLCKKDASFPTLRFSSLHSSLSLISHCLLHTRDWNWIFLNCIDWLWSSARLMKNWLRHHFYISPWFILCLSYNYFEIHHYIIIAAAYTSSNYDTYRGMSLNYSKVCNFQYFNEISSIFADERETRMKISSYSSGSLHTIRAFR